MEKRVVYTEKAPKPIGPYSQAVLVEGGKFLFVSGQIPIDPATGEIVGETIEEQAERAIRNMLAIVEEAGGSVENIVKVTAFLSDINDYPKFNEVYEKFFSKSKPARAVVEVANLPKGVKVEIECIAVL
ncbi:RidA family protein [Thermococcus sp.]|uniref:RidA family protein n=1 Tax=Thermococcus sp. TaxID=35749 RepID=UPI00260DACF7|nr:RidA family protein [Thermococcus sp.]